jgi:hypothetical protein
MLIIIAIRIVTDPIYLKKLFSHLNIDYEIKISNPKKYYFSLIQKKTTIQSTIYKTVCSAMIDIFLSNSDKGSR